MGEGERPEIERDIASEKSLLRYAIGSKRRDRAEQTRIASANGIAEQVQQYLRDRGTSSRTVAAYISTEFEPGTRPLLDTWRGEGMDVLIPRARDAGVLEWGRYTDGSGLRSGRHGIEEPVGPSVGIGAEGLLANHVGLLMIPALAVDLAGHRLGQGGGYYDRLLADLAGAGGSDLPSDLAIIAVVYDDEVLPAGGIPVEQHDRLVSAAVTPTRTISLPAD